MYCIWPNEVYNYVHRKTHVVRFPLIRFVVTLNTVGYDVNFVSNFTDVDDKIIRVANETGMTAEEVSKKYISEAFFEDTNA